MPGTLEGRTILVTRPRAQAGTLVESLRARGARVIVAPAIRVVPAPAKAIDAALDGAVSGAFAWILVTSRAGAEALLARLAAHGRTPRDVRAEVGAVGEGTASALRAGGLRPALVPSSYTTEALGRAMPSGSGTVLLARADIAPEGLERALRRKGWTVERIDAYRTRFPGTLPVAARRALAGGAVDAVTFTSASTVRGFLEAAGGVFRHPAMAAAGHAPKVVCIGPVTAAEARSAGLRVHATADPHTIEGLVAAVERALRGRARGGRGKSDPAGPSHRKTTKEPGRP
jgi:uroporphyrinogen III methyltransferase / synthase